MSLLLPGLATAGPLYDPFLEAFQVGTYGDPDKVDLAYGLPGGLLDPIRQDGSWWQAAWQATRPPAGIGSERELSRRLLRQAMTADAAAAWLAERRRVLAPLRPGVQTRLADWENEHPFLRGERFQIAFFEALYGGALDRAVVLAQRLSLENAELGLNVRQRFVWELRHLLVDTWIREEPALSADFWRSVPDLGSYDASNAWAIWIAHRRELERPLVPVDLSGRQDALFLGRLYRSWLDPEDLEASALEPELIGGLGANLLDREDLAEHFHRYPDPPRDLTLQGWWVKGRRQYLRGDAAAYERLASRNDLLATWKLDVWRRASERRLLAGQWTEGLHDLQAALDLAHKGQGTQSLRRRLRQWTEQALVLAVAQGDDDLARRILEMGDAAFQDEEAVAYREETAYWRHILTGGEPGTYIEQQATRTVQSRRRVEAGFAQPLAKPDEQARENSLEDAYRSLWGLWFQWGLSLSQVDGIPADRLQRSRDYGDLMRAGLEQSSEEDRQKAALVAVVDRFEGREILNRLLEAALARDIQTVCANTSPPESSPVPRLAGESRGSQLDLHALLGYALLAGDMRGILATATPLPGTGLTADQKLHFLYPLPAPGPIRQALVEAHSETSLLLAVARNESLFEPAVRSRAGALGWMQIMPFHYADRGARSGLENWRSPAVSIAAGDRLLVENNRRYEGEPYLSVAAYNAGPGAAGRWRKQLGGAASADVYLAWIGYPETRHYVEKVLIDRVIYDWILHAANAPSGNVD